MSMKSTAVTFREWAERFVYPTTLKGPIASRLVASVALVCDVAEELTEIALQARSLHSPYFPRDALPLVGSERMLRRYPADTDAGYRQRLMAAWDTWLIAGTVPGILNQLALAGYPAYMRENAASIPAPDRWNWDGLVDDWSRFWTVITTHGFSRWYYDDGHVWDGGQTWDSTATVDDVGLLRGIIRKWKPGHVRCSHIVLVMEQTPWAAGQPDGTWGDEANRNLAAIYIPG